MDVEGDLLLEMLLIKKNKISNTNDKNGIFILKLISIYLPE